MELGGISAVILKANSLFYEMGTIIHVIIYNIVIYAI